MTRVSVAMATRNGVRFVDEQLVSIIRQSRVPDEIVVSDDRSDDGTLDRVAEIARDDEIALVVVGNESPLGVARNFEAALLLTTGDLVALADQDDRWNRDRISSCLPLFEADRALLLLHGDADLVADDGRGLDRTLFRSLEVSSAELAEVHAGRAFDVLLRRNIATGATVMLRRELLDAALPIPDGWIHDEWLAIIAAALGGLEVVERPLIEYRQHSSNQIGAQRLTLAYKVSRVLGRRGDRNLGLAQRAAVLVDRLEALSPAVPKERIAAARGKLRFERRRARMPRCRALRVGSVIVLAARGDYSRYASRRGLDVLRDLLQPA